ncbi:MAG: TetR/AcrR family transcriptional regulator [Chlorobiaceae bacterium]|nr:TetR/AcrR family transcriptional regulator [Chlorobiaceae bacterium]NTV61846.1 TetR/AcrR family transcriptional regulator [Chlorobiaceae bacterium]
MRAKKEDRRINRTRKLILEALMSLIIERGYENVTVQDIIDRADVGRSTFYAHFRDKDELLISWFEHLRTLFEQQQQELLDARKTGKEPGLNIVLDLFRHTGNHHRLYKAVAGRQSGEMILKYLHRYLTGLLLPILEDAVKKRPSLPIPVEVTTHHLVSSLLSLMTWWLDRNMPYPPEKMEGMFRTLVRPSLEAALGKDIVQDAGITEDGGLKNEEVVGFYSLFADPSCCR